MEENQHKIRIETRQILVDFKQHLNQTGNKRILFSGPFGTGKSTFLKEFSENENEDFFYLKIFPVNYSVSANEDVFELIKFDLLLQLIGNHYEEIELKKEDFTLLLKSQIFIMERMKFMPLLYAILGFSDKIGTPIVKFIEALEKTVKDFKAFNKEIKIDEENDISAFLESIQNIKGSSHEMDAVSELIYDLIGRIKTKYQQKESILIIDDLDRLDPEHIFRLFNIFSAHYDEINDKNKFGFDKVIFVCDIDNIRKIFHHKYGTDVDFSGYIDKFYSINPFDFDNRKYVKEKIDLFLKEIRFKDKSLEFYNFYSNTRFLICSKSILNSLVDARLLNLRMILQYPVLNVSNFYFGVKKRPIKNTINTPIIVLFHLLKNFYGSFDLLLIKIKALKELFSKEMFKSNIQDDYFTDNDENIKQLISYCLPIILNICEDNQSVNNIFSEKYNCTFYYKHFLRNEYNFVEFLNATYGKIEGAEEIKLNPYEILLETFEICYKQGLLR